MAIMEKIIVKEARMRSRSLCSAVARVGGSHQSTRQGPPQLATCLSGKRTNADELSMIKTRDQKIERVHYSNYH